MTTATSVPGAEEQLEMYRRMVRIRVFETEAEKLFSKGELVGSIHTSVGQEGSCVGAGMALRNDDMITGTHRSHGHPIGKGAPIGPLMAELFGRTTGICKGLGGSMHLADFAHGSVGETAVVASSLPIATGAALASKMQGWDRVVLSFFGDGASNAGAFHESVNMAAIWNLPIVFFCENNTYAVSTRHEDVSAVKDIAERAVAYGIRGEVVDGQDVLAVWQAVSRAVESARAGGGPVLIEAKTYRYGDHSYLMSRLGSYRDESEVDLWRGRDPIEIHRKYLLDNELATAEVLDGIEQETAAEIAQSIADGRTAPTITGPDLWQYMYDKPDGFRARSHNAAWTAAMTPAGA
jgi:acetoin:2,6-dichlorophenolindophenol oxidoreductase subunit alpha